MPSGLVTTRLPSPGIGHGDEEPVAVRDVDPIIIAVRGHQTRSQDS